MDPKKSVFKYSLKNIPIPKPEIHTKETIPKAEDVIQRFRWKTLFHFNPSKHDNKKTYGFNTTRNAPQHPLLGEFEDGVGHIISDLDYTKKRTKFQRQLIEDQIKIQKSDKVFVRADKTRNLYEVDKATYNKLILENITSNYKLTTEETEDKINKQAKKITEELKIDDRVEPL